MDNGLSHRVPGQPGNPHTIHRSSIVLEGVRISSYLVQHIGRVCSPFPSILSKNAHSIRSVFFFCYISRKCACVPSLPLFSSTHLLSTGLNSASCVSAALDMGGTAQAHMVPLHCDALTVLLLEGGFEIRQPCALCVASELSDWM